MPKICYCLFKTLQPENGTLEGGSGGIFKVISCWQLGLLALLIFALLDSAFFLRQNSHSGHLIWLFLLWSRGSVDKGFSGLASLLGLFFSHLRETAVSGLGLPRGRFRRQRLAEEKRPRATPALLPCLPCHLLREKSKVPPRVPALWSREYQLELQPSRR